jgi:UPF0755 protein
VKAVRLLTLAALVIGGFAGYRLASPYQGFQGETFVNLPRGTSTSAMADLLVQAGVIRGRADFLAARLISQRRVLQAGEYRFNRPATPLGVVDRIARGDIFYYELLVPEGKNMFDIAAAAEQLGLFKAGQFLAAARDPHLIRDLDPQAPTLEGFLFPDTYKLGRQTTPEDLCRIMTGKFREAWKSRQRGTNAQDSAQNNTGDNSRDNAGVHRTITLASLVEKEGKLPAERTKIAAVFENRLRIGMKLDCDPTTIYAALLDGRYRGVIHRSDLDSDNLYNTYRHVGLPPGPIANPGLAAVRAVEAPEPSDALYFVARPDGSGAHEFSSTIARHQDAVEKYRRANR